ncbi:carbamoyltransferase [Streptomyces sp. ME18-1-4]|uniref:carbamoyltransferase family protein n=1 Tax=Streptomyces sp. ME18-1-4 TaxID=3028685 RepID=UPI0029A8E50F|nr:carbamoyltransferase C-terminal domain-containing protein [Streptomyces sp. ME18-1-4]MDX3241318.1 carbamoyltransferase C-terminal domain-containing protein [Streptomyces sp. ME18-1-4]
MSTDRPETEAASAGLAGFTQRPVHVLGVNTGPHDGSAALLRDGVVVSMVEQERLSRNRYAPGESPREAVHSCLADAGLRADSLDVIAVGWDLPRLSATEGADFDEDRFRSWLLGPASADRSPSVPIRCYDHHLAHAASAFYTSGVPSAAVIVADGRGESAATTLAVGTPDGIDVVKSWGTRDSLGHFYGWAAEWAGLTVWGAGKLMGLAAYGRPRQSVPLVVEADDYAISAAPPAEAPVRMHYALSRSRLRAHFRTANFPFREAQVADVMAYSDFAASVQDGLEEALLALARAARRITEADTLALAGGVALNCAANGRLSRSGLFGDLWIPPVPNDAGVSLGAALLADRELRGPRWRPPERMRHAFRAPRSAALRDEERTGLSKWHVEQCAQELLARKTAQHLADGLVVALWQGRAEIGQRALGARSILCDPRRREALTRVNELKGREGWRPLALAVPAEHWGRYFEGEAPAPSAYMLVAVPVRESMRAGVPAGVHVDGTTRPQVVHARQTLFHAILRAFHDLTGVPCLVNTSFNLAGRPMVLSRGDALETFARSALDVLVMDDLLIRKPDRAVPARARERRPRALSFTPWNDVPRPQTHLGARGESTS